MQLEFCEPPALQLGGPGRRNNHRFVQMAETLQERPGEWAKWPFDCASPYTVAGHIKQGRYATLPPDRFEALVRARQLYVRARAA